MEKESLKSRNKLENGCVFQRFGIHFRKHKDSCCLRWEKIVFKSIFILFAKQTKNLLSLLEIRTQENKV